MCLLSSNVYASPYCTAGCTIGHRHHYNSYYYSSHSVYLVRKEINEEERKFPNCDEHTAIVQTSINYYSDGTRRIYTNYTITNKDGFVLEDNCSEVKHIIYNDQHYFVVRKNKKYKILNGEGTTISRKLYSKMSEIEPNKLLVKYDKMYGIIDLTEKNIVPIKYKSFEQIGPKLFITKLNGYYGILDSSNNITVKNEFDKIKPLHETFLLKKEGKYGLANFDGQVIVEPNCDKIKKLGEFILVKKDKHYTVLDYEGNSIDNIEYKKIRLNRNQLEGLTNSKVWRIIENKI